MEQELGYFVDRRDDFDVADPLGERANPNTTAGFTTVWPGDGGDKDGCLNREEGGLDEIEPLSAFTAQRYCRRCNGPQPLRAWHCRQCGRCVARFDHHCFWLGTCIGAQNFRALLCFLMLETALAVLSICLLGLTLYMAYAGEAQLRPPQYVNADVLQSSNLIVTAWVAIGVAGVGVWHPLMLLVYHCYLAATNQTTWEHWYPHRIWYLRDAKIAGHIAGVSRTLQPFNRGILHNIHGCIRGLR